MSSTDESEEDSQEERGQKRKRSEKQTNEFDPMFDDIPDAVDESPLKRVAALDGKPGQRLQIISADGARTEILAESSAVINVCTPMKQILRQPSFRTPERTGRLKSLTDEQKLGLANLFIKYARHVAPHRSQKGLENPFKRDIRDIYRNQKIGSKYLKELVQDPDTLATYIMGKSNVRVLSSQPKGDGLLTVIHQVMSEEYPVVDPSEYTPEMMRKIEEKIMEKLKTLVKN